MAFMPALVPLLAFLAPGLGFGAASFKTTTMANGLEIVSVESHKVPLVTIVLTSKAGGMTETPEIDGLTHLWEHMFFKGNRRIPNQEAFNRRIRQLGIVYNGDTSAEKVRYYFTLPSANLDEGLRFMADAIISPLLDKEELKKERRVVLNEYDRSASQPQFDLRRLRRRLIYGKLDYLRDPLGNRTIIENASRKQLLQIKKDVFVPKNSAILVAGDFTQKQLEKSVKKYFSQWENPKKWQPKKAPAFAAFPKTNRFTMIRKQASNASLSITFAGPKARQQPKESFAADILISLLGLKSGAFQKKFVESGLAFHTGLSYHTQSQAGEISLFASTKAENLKKLEALLRKEIALWSKPNYFTNEQLADIQRSLLVSHKFELNRPSSFIKTLGFWWAVTGLDYYGNYLNNLRKVKISDIQAFVKEFLIKKPNITAILVAPAGAKKAKIRDTSNKLWKKHFPQ